MGFDLKAKLAFLNHSYYPWLCTHNESAQALCLQTMGGWCEKLLTSPTQANDDMHKFSSVLPSECSAFKI